MYIFRSNSFKKDYKKLTTYQKYKTEKALALFQENPTHPSLHNHKLKGIMVEFYSIKADYDLRIVYKYQDNRIIVFLVSVGTHESVY